MESSSPSSARVILVDDEVYVTTMLASKLRQAGFQVEIATNGDEGFALARQHPPDLIITDCKMPVLSGLEMSLKLRQDPITADVPVMMLSGHGYQVTSDQMARTRIRAILEKPFSARDLVAKVRELLSPPTPPPPP